MTIGIITIILIFVIEHLGTIFEMAIGIGSVLSGPLLGLFVLGLFFPWSGKKGAISGGCISFIIMAWIVFGTQWHILNKRIRYSNLPTSTANCNFALNETLTSTTEKPVLAPDDEPMLVFRVSIFFLILIGTIIAVVVGVITSLCVGESDLTKVDPQHVLPCIRR